MATPAKPDATKVKNKTISSVTVFAAGDIADCRKTSPEESDAAKTARLIEKQLEKNKQAFVITLGDNTYPIGKAEEYRDCYEPTWGKFKSRTLPAPGNHDYGMPLALAYYNYFDELAGPDRRGYYKKRLGSWLFLSLNSNLKDVQMQEQMQWLRAQLKDRSQSCTIAVWHHPVFSSGGHGNNDVMLETWQILANAKVDIVLTSHEHNYERLTPLNANGVRDDKNGIRSFIVGTGGVKLTPMFFPKYFTEVRNNETHGVLQLDLHDKTYDWAFLSVAEKSFSDVGRGQCH